MKKQHYVALDPISGSRKKNRIILEVKLLKPLALLTMLLVCITQQSAFSQNTSTTYGTRAGKKLLWDNHQTSVFGFEAGQELTEGKENTLVGYRAGKNMTTNWKNTIIGSKAGINTSGHQNTILGYEAGGQAGGGNIFIGFQAGAAETSDNKLYINNSATNNPLIYGEFDNRILKINGNLGIGINPSQKLDVNGAIKSKAIVLNKNGTVDVGITQEFLGGLSSMLLTTSDGTTQTTRMLIRGNTNEADIEFYRGAKGSEKNTLIIKGDNGHVGIGRTNPSQKLDVNGAIKSNAIILNNDGIGDVGIRQQLIGGTHSMELTTSDGSTQTTRMIIRGGKAEADIEFYSGGGDTTTLIVKGDGHVGIGNSSPKIDLAIGDSDTGLQQQGDGKLAIYTNNSERLRVDNAGNVAIGQTTATEKLEVNGKIKANGVILNVGSFPDYVFAADYNLMPLAIVEAHINTHNRLPNMPSEAEVLENGMDVGHVNILLVEKVEELTLHTIAQEKEIEALKVALKALMEKFD